MAFPTTNAATELPAINQILMACGQAPVTTLDETNPDVAIAYQTLLEVSREVQSEGWTFNKEDHVEVTPNSDNQIPILTNYLQIDLTQSNAGDKKVIQKNGLLYDKQNHTDKWTDGAVECDILWLFDWVDLPRPIQDYITARASTITSSRIVGDQTQYKMLQQKEAYMRAMALEYETNQGDYSFFGEPDGAHPYVGYQPYHALKR
jgi:hypothetical protein